MSKDFTDPACADLGITNEYRGWRPTQGWLADRIRMVGTRLYSQAISEGGTNGENSPVAVHKAAITAQVSKAFGALYEETTPHFSGSWILDLLVQLRDFGHIGHGYHIPRESRIVRLTSQWGRIAGGLPTELSEHPDIGIEFVMDGTVGRLVKLHRDFAKYDHDTEHSEVYEWLASTEEQIHSRLLARLPDRVVTRPPSETTEFYNAGFRRGHKRRERWHNKMPSDTFVVARTKILPAHYYIISSKPDQREKVWFEVENEEARRWILLAEKRTGVLNRIQMARNDMGRMLFLPDMLPGAWTRGILSCASTVTLRDEGGWMLEVQTEAHELLEIILRSANIHLI